MGLSTEIRDATAKAASGIQIEPALLLAVVQVESAGQAFEADGSTPRFLFERHVFYRELTRAGKKTQLAEAVKTGLAHKAWKKDTQYKDQGTSFARVALLARARRIDEECALRSCSWGLGQTMGNLYGELGYESAASLVEDYRSGVPAQVGGMVKFIQSKGLDRKLALKDFPGFALGYNGKGYKQNAYDSKIAAAYESWKKVYTPAESGDVEGYALKRGDVSEAVKDLQARLREKNYQPGLVDGKFGQETELAVVAFQHANNLDGTRGIWVPEYDDVLRAAEPRFENRQTATTKDVEKLSSAARGAGLFQRVLAWLGLGSLGGAAVEQSLPGTLTAYQTTVEPLVSSFSWLVSNKPLFFGFLFLVGAVGLRFVLIWLRNQFRAGVFNGTKPA